MARISSYWVHVLRQRSKSYRRFSCSEFLIKPLGTYAGKIVGIHSKMRRESMTSSGSIGSMSAVLNVPDMYGDNGFIYAQHPEDTFIEDSEQWGAFEFQLLKVYRRDRTSLPDELPI